MEYDDAEKFCRFTEGSVVVQPKTKEEHDNLLNFLKTENITEPIWVGIHCDSTDPSDCQWDDVTHLDGFNNFASGSPNSKDSCVVFQTENQGKWVSSSCEQTNRFVCELPPTTKDCYNSKCDINYNNNCYSKFSRTEKFIDAEKHCQLNNAHLVSIHSYLEWRLVAEMFRNQGQYWVGGVMDRNDEGIVWIDGTTEDFSFSPSKKVFVDGICVQIGVDSDALGSVYYGRQCEGLASFICKRPVC